MVLRAVEGRSDGEGPPGEKQTFPKRVADLPREKWLRVAPELDSVGKVSGAFGEDGRAIWGRSQKSDETFPTRNGTEGPGKPKWWGRSPLVWGRSRPGEPRPARPAGPRHPATLAPSRGGGLFPGWWRACRILSCRGPGRCGAWRTRSRQYMPERPQSSILCS